jgi:beta-glucanase (GH16 family)
MASLSTARIAAGAAAGLAVAVAWADPVPKASENTGSPAGAGFLIDLKKGHDNTTQYLADYETDADWIKIAYRSDNIRFDKTGMTLQLTKTGGRLPFSGSEFHRRGTYGYGRYEAVLRASDAHGAVASFFIYTGPYFGDPQEEIDIEFMGRAPRQIHLNYFRNGEDDSINIPLWFDSSQGDHLYAFEWAPDSIRWYVDGHKIHEVTSATAKAGIPTTTGRVMVNLWAGAGDTTSWTGEPRFTQAKAAYRCISHVPIAKTGPQCSDSFTPPPKP